MNKLAKIVFRVVLVILAIVLIDWLIGFIPLLLRGGCGPQNGVKFKPEPYLMSVMARDEDQICVSNLIFVNDQFYRHPANIEGKPTKPRYFILGGSVAWGGGASCEDKMWLTYLRLAFPDIEFINAACQSWVSQQQFVRLAADCWLHEPVGVIFFDGFNDLALPLIWGNTPGAPWRWTTYEAIMSQDLWRQFKAIVESHSNIALILNRLNGPDWLAMRDGGRSKMAESLFAYLVGSANSFEFCKRMNIKPFQIIQPILAVEKEMTPKEQRMMTERVRLNLKRFYPMFAEGQKNLSKNYGVPCLDLATIFSFQKETIYTDLCHFNDAGHKLVGETIAAWLKEQGVK